MFIVFVYACVFRNVNKLESGMRVHQNTWGRVSQAQKRDLERDEEVRAFVAFGVPVWMLVDAQMNHRSSNVHAQWFSCWKIQADDHDVSI